MVRNRKTFDVAAVLICALLIGACGSQDSAAPDVGGESTKQADAAVIAAPNSKAVLTLTGDISNHNAGDGLAFDVASLEQLPTRTLEVFEPFLKKRVTFTGVDMADLLATAGIPSSAKSAQFTALDDYKVDLDLSMLRSEGIMMATRDSGKAIPVDEGGPVRIIFPDGNDTGKNSDLWIWSVTSIQVR